MTIIPLAIPTVSFGQVQNRMVRLWDPFERNPHVVLIGTSGSGKTHVIRHHLLPLRSSDRTVVIDSKQDRDIAWEGYGRAVTELPPEFSRTGNEEDPFVWRVIVDRRNAQAQLRRVFDQIRDEGHCTVVVDESRSITEREQAGLSSVVENLILEGRGLGVTMIMGAQSLAYAVPSLKDQPAVLFIGQCAGPRSEQAKALASMAGYGRELAEVIGRVPARTWLYRDLWDSSPILGLTRAPAA